MEAVCVKIRLKPGSENRVREWARELTRRRPEALETLRDEGVVLESAFLGRDAEGEYLVYYMRAADLKRAFAMAGRSVHPIDAYHRAFKEATWVKQEPLELLVDLDRTDER